MGSVVENEVFLHSRNDGYHSLLPGFTNNTSYNESTISSQKIHFPSTHDYKFVPGEELEIRSGNSNIPRRGVCIKEYPYFYLFRTVPKDERQETYNFAVNKAMLYSGIDHVEFKYPN